MEVKNTDLRLSAAYKRLDSGKVSVLSVDVFDTLLWRLTPSPYELCLILGKVLKAQGWLIPAVTAECFATLRIGAEQLARYHKVGGSMGTTVEVTLREIYWCLAGAFKKITFEQMARGEKGIVNESDVDDLIQIELELDKQFTRFDLNILKLVHYANKKNIPVVLISDTSLEQLQMAAFLDRIDPVDGLPFPPKVSQIFLSCEEGIGKRHGLFSKVLETLKVPPKSLLHVGDIYLTDIAPAKKLGIATAFYPKYDAELQTIIQKEWPDNNYTQREQMLDLKHGDFGLSALRGKVENHTEQKKLKNGDAFFWQYGATVLGPIVTGFVHWLYERSAELGHTKIFCLMREGRLYANLIKEYAPFHPSYKLDPIELWVSRYFMFSMSVFLGDARELLFLINAIPVMRFTVGQFCNILGLDMKQLPKYAKYEHLKLDNEKFCEELCNHLASDMSLREQIVQHSAVRRQRFIKYLSSYIDLSSASQMILADVGWIGTTQSVLQNVLNREGYKIKLHGLYLCTEEKTMAPLLQGFVKEGFLLKAGFPLDAITVIKRALCILELPALTGMGAMVDISEEGKIITGESATTKKQLKEAGLVQQGIKAFCRELGQYVQKGLITLDASSEAFQSQLRQNLLRASGDPTHEEAKHFIEFSHDAASRRLGKSFILSKSRYYEKFVGNIFPNMQEWKIAWPAAYAAKYDEYLPMAYQAVQRQILPPGCFLSHDSLTLKIYVDTGKGFPKRASEVVAMHSNATRSFFALTELVSAKKAINKLKLEIDSGSAMIRIKSLRLILNRRTSPALEQQAFFESGNGNEKSSKNDHPVDISHAKTIDHNTFFTTDKLSLTINLPHQDIYAAQVNLICEKFDLPRK